MLKGGVIMDVVNPEQARIAEDAGAVAVMALERVPSDIRKEGGVSRMSDPEMIQGIQEVCSIPVMAKARIGHFAEAQILQSLGVDYIDESEGLTPADETHHIDKFAFDVPFGPPRGTRVVCVNDHLGQRCDGGYAEFARLPTQWLTALPDSMDNHTAMAMGTAGFTAMQCVLHLERSGALDAPDATVLVTGAAGGVGSRASVSAGASPGMSMGIKRPSVRLLARR